MHLVRGTRRSHALRSSTGGAVVAAAPAGVEYGLPGSHAYVAEYASLLQSAWEDFLNKDFLRWGKNKGVSSSLSEGRIIMGEVVGGTPAERDMVLQITKDYGEFKAYKAVVDEDSIVADHPATAWQKLVRFEERLKNDRALFTEVTGSPLASPDPGNVEKKVNPPSGGGVSTTVDRLSTSLENVVTVAGIGVALYFGFTYVVPLLFGAAAKSRAAKSDYNRAG